MNSPTCSVCKNVSESQRYISICSTCNENGYDLDVYEQIFLPYFEITSESEVLAVMRINTIGILVRDSFGSRNKKEATMVKKELTLDRTHRVDIGALLEEKKDMRDCIIGDYLKVARSKIKVGQVKTAFALRGYAKQILPSDPVQALFYLRKRPELCKRGKKLDVEKLRDEFFYNADLFASVCTTVGSVIAAFAAVTMRERRVWKLEHEFERYYIGDKIPLLKPHEEMLKNDPLVLLKSSLTDNGISMEKMDEFLGRQYFRTFLSRFTGYDGVALSAKHDKIAKEMVHYTETVGEVEARRAYFKKRYGNGYDFNPLYKEEYISGKNFLGETGLHLGCLTVTYMRDC